MNAMRQLFTFVFSVQRIWDSVALPVASNVSSSSSFSLTLVGSTRIALRSSIVAFANGTTVSIGGVMCTSTRVSDDGLWLVTITPSQAQLCADGIDCGYKVGQIERMLVVDM